MQKNDLFKFSSLASISCCLGKSCQTWLFFTCLCLNGTWDCRAAFSICVCTHLVPESETNIFRAIEWIETKEGLRRCGQHGLSALQRKLEVNYKAQIMFCCVSVASCYLWPLTSCCRLLMLTVLHVSLRNRVVNFVLTKTNMYDCVSMS